jgi:hypothetical protein
MTNPNPVSSHSRQCDNTLYHTRFLKYVWRITVINITSLLVIYWLLNIHLLAWNTCVNANGKHHNVTIYKRALPRDFNNRAANTVSVLLQVSQTLDKPGIPRRTQQGSNSTAQIIFCGPVTVSVRVLIKRVICTSLTQTWYNFTHMKFCVQNAEFRVNHLTEYIRIIMRLNMYVSASSHKQSPFSRTGQLVSPYSFNIQFSWTHVRFCENDGGWASLFVRFLTPQVRLLQTCRSMCFAQSNTPN